MNGTPSAHALIPARDSSAVTGSAFIQANMNLGGPTREANILKEFMSGNIPDFLRKFVPITITLGNDSITYLVMSDILSIGNDADYIRMPMNPHTAQTIADKYDCTLPTKKMVDDIWANAVYKLEPLPWGPPYDADMLASHRVLTQNQKIQAQLVDKDITKLISGHKKDVILDNALSPHNPNKRVCIYGWIQANGKAIQGVNPVSHEDTYEDYSHGIRMIANDVIVNGNVMRMQDVFSDPKLAGLVSSEGVLTFTRY